MSSLGFYWPLVLPAAVSCMEREDNGKISALATLSRFISFHYQVGRNLLKTNLLCTLGRFVEICAHLIQYVLTTAFQWKPMPAPQPQMRHTFGSMKGIIGLRTIQCCSRLHRRARIRLLVWLGLWNFFEEMDDKAYGKPAALHKRLH